MDVEDVSSLSISALKALIQKGGLSFEDCIDKDDLRARAKEAQDRLASAPPPTTTSSSATTGQRADRVLAGYPCIIKGPPELLDGSGGAPADLVLVCLHGLGASNTDFADILPLLASNECARGERVPWHMCTPCHDAPAAPDCNCVSPRVHHDSCQAGFGHGSHCASLPASSADANWDGVVDF